MTTPRSAYEPDDEDERPSYVLSVILAAGIVLCLGGGIYAAVTHQSAVAVAAFGGFLAVLVAAWIWIGTPCA